MFTLICVLLLIVIQAVVRIAYVRWVSHNRTNRRRENGPTKILIILGLGGHTDEMLTIVSELMKDNYTPTFYVLETTGKTIEVKNRTVKSARGGGIRSDFEVFCIKSREVGRNVTWAVWRMFESILQCIPLVFRLQPDLILWYGPGTCIAYLLKSLFINTECRIVAVESDSRIRTISLGDKILIGLYDKFVV